MIGYLLKLDKIFYGYLFDLQEILKSIFEAKKNSI